MFVRNVDIDSQYTQLEVDLMINRLLLNVDEFATYSCLYGQVYGVETLYEECDIEVNQCVRKEIPRLLLSNQEMVEKHVNYKLTPSYISEKIVLSAYNNSYQLEWPGLSEIHVAQGITALDGLDAVAIDPYVQRDITVAANDEDVCIVSFDSSIVKNPNDAIIRDDTNKYYPTADVAGYPVRNSGDWEIAVSGLTSPCADPSPLNIQHNSLIKVDITTPVCDGEVMPVYPGTSQVIPQSAEPEAISGGKTRYWFHSWVLVDPAFYNEDINLATPEFYKLLETIEFKCFASVTTAPVIYSVGRDDDCTLDFVVGDYTASIYVLDAVKSYVHIEIVGCCSCCSLPFSQCCTTAWQVELFYRTSPSILKTYGDTVLAETAISNITAAELPLKACKCEIKEGFIFEAQKPYNKIMINQQTGDVYSQLKIGNFYGQLVYLEQINKMTTHSKSVVL